MADHLNILVVDDEPIVCQLIVDILSLEGHTVKTCSRGQEALASFQDNGDFDLVFLDLGLPDVDGFQVMAEIRQRSPSVLIVIITGDATIDSAVEALKSGAYDYLRKPFYTEDLLKTVKNALDHKILDESRRKSEKALKESEERFRALVENSLIGICIFKNNKVVYQNPEQQKLFGPLTEKSLNKLLRYIHPEDSEKVVESYGNLLAGKENSVALDFRFFPGRRRGKNPTVKWVQTRASLFKYQGDDAVLINTMDITRFKELEHILRLKSKMISLGRVAAGIAHEIRNPLTGINSYLYTLEDLLDADDYSEEDIMTMKQIVEQMQVASNKIESVIKRVLDFSRPGAPSMSLINLNQPMEEAMKLSAVSLRKKDIEVETRLDDKLPQCYGDPHLIEQVVLNLIDNAVKAMAQKNGDKHLVLHTYSKNGNIYLNVSDSGPGIPMGIREKIFDPFFTTDADGSGIGLAISQRIINDHNGTITMESNEWGGADFIIELPIDKRMR
jgi:PAS domain S-box-containing protein